MNEHQIIKNYFSKLTNNNPSALNLNDDVFFDKKNRVVVSVDTYVENIHFPNFKNPELIIKKVIRASISDLVCKGVAPIFYFISGSGNLNSFNKKNLSKILKSMKNEQRKFSIKLSGGDTVYSKKNSFTAVTLGYSTKIVKRNNAKLNDDIYVTGNIGDSSLGLNLLKTKKKIPKKIKDYFINKFYLPEINLEFSKYLYSFANTSIDISDGILIDLDKMTNNQNFSLEINLDKIPLSKKMCNFLQFTKTRKKYIFDGEDYQILFTAPVSKRNKIFRISKKTKTKVTIIGKVIRKKKIKFNLLNKGNVSNIPKKHGYEHKFK
mgnify:CR=1 FL=1|tara:strand:+ start:3574 stop:4536 length:963 start_codon:yes stop_codon:yes gene_type:complete